MNKRVYGVLGISSIMANWNADFSGNPKTISDGTVFGSDKAFKYPIKKMWQEQGEKVLYIKSLKLSKNKEGTSTVVPRSLKERYEHIFDEAEVNKKTDSKEILTNLFKAIDVKNFGATFAEEGNNISITGAVQIGQGLNKYDGTEVEEQQILSPFRDASDKGDGKKEEAKNSTLGTKIVSNEAHYFYPFAINPSAYNDFVEMGVTEGYTEEDYNKFKKASLCAATSFATNAKIGCENEFALFVEAKEDTYLPNLSSYIDFVKGEKGHKNKIIINASDLLSKSDDKIHAIEVYFNTNTTEIVSDINNAKIFDIFTLQEV